TVVFIVVSHGCCDNFLGALITVGFANGYLVGFARNHFVGLEVVGNTVDKCGRNFGNVIHMAESRVVLDDSNDLVIRFAAIVHRQAAQYFGFDDDFGAVNWTLAEYADVQGVAVATFCTWHQVTHTVAAVGARDKTVKSGLLGRSGLRTVDEQVSTVLVDFVLHLVKRGDFDIGIYQAGYVWACRDAMPGMRTKTRVCS